MGMIVFHRHNAVLASPLSLRIPPVVTKYLEKIVLMRCCSTVAASDIHWLNCVDGEACLLVDSYRDLRDGEAVAEVVAVVQVLYKHFLAVHVVRGRCPPRDRDGPCAYHTCLPYEINPR